jgi:hypothetical protein
MFGADCFPILSQPTVEDLEPLSHRTLSGAHRIVRCPHQTVGSATRHARIARPTVGSLKGKCVLGPFLSILVIECQHKWTYVNLGKVMDKVQIK